MARPIHSLVLFGICAGWQLLVKPKTDNLAIENSKARFYSRRAKAEEIYRENLWDTITARNAYLAQHGVIVPPTKDELNTFSYENLLKRDEYLVDYTRERAHQQQQQHNNHEANTASSSPAHSEH